jgi:hypothetical protein
MGICTNGPLDEIGPIWPKAARDRHNCDFPHKCPGHLYRTAPVLCRNAMAAGIYAIYDGEHAKIGVSTGLRP